MRRRIVVEMETMHDEITEGACRRFIEAILREVPPLVTRRRGIVPSSLKAKQYSRVVAAEYGANPERADKELS